jgi:hypothetical protein
MGAVTSAYMSFYGFVGALAFLGLGVIELAVVNRVVYPSLRWRYEKAKTTQEQGVDPGTIMLLVKIQSLLVLPLLGLFLGDRMKSIFG